MTVGDGDAAGDGNAAGGGNGPSGGGPITPPPGDPTVGALFAEVQRMQAQLEEAQRDAASQAVEGVAGDGAVRISVTGDLSFQQVHIDETLVAGGDVGIIEDLVLVALRDAVSKLESLGESSIGSMDDLSTLLSGGVPGIGALGDLLGGLEGADTGELFSMLGSQIFGGLSDAEDGEDDEDDEDDDPPSIRS
jgi:DNA-binding YbaB/EbfC family protein